MLPLFTAYYNLVREHQAIGKTPAKAAGIDLKLGHDKWKEVIRKAQEYKRTGGKERVWELQCLNLKGNCRLVFHSQYGLSVL